MKGCKWILMSFRARVWLRYLFLIAASLLSDHNQATLTSVLTTDDGEEEEEEDINNVCLLLFSF